MLEESGVEIFKTCIVRTFIDVLVLALQRKSMLECLNFFITVLRMTAYHDTRKSPNCYGLKLACFWVQQCTKCSLYKAFQVRIFFHHFHTMKQYTYQLHVPWRISSSRIRWFHHFDVRRLASACNSCSVLWPCYDQSRSLVWISDSRVAETAVESNLA